MLSGFGNYCTFSKITINEGKHALQKGKLYIRVSFLRMKLEHYRYSVNESLQTFEFESEGPNGKIRKIVRFSPENADGVTYFNIAFGDAIDGADTLNDEAVSDNKDTVKILATVAATVMEFTEYFPDIMLYAKGSTPGRTRLYQMGIAANWDEIEPVLKVYGFKEGKWLQFRKNINYEAFLAVRKKT